MQTSITADAGIARERAAAQRLSAPGALTPGGLVAWLGAVQAQDYPLATWSVAQRLAGKRPDVGRAIADGSILRTHVLRPTWHFVAPGDLRWMQELTSPRVIALMRQMDSRNGIDAALIARATSVIATAIERQGHLTRPAVRAALARAGIAATPWMVGHFLMHAELRAVICSGVPEDRRQTYALVDERAPKSASMTRDEALAALALRYFRSHGPATARDYQWWSGLSAADVARGIHLLGDGVDRTRVGDRTYIACHAGRRAGPKARTAHVIQPYDEFVVAYTESRDVVDVLGAARRAGPSGGGALLTRGVVYDGQLVARWHMRPAGRSPAIAVRALRRLTPAERAAVTAAAARFERFLYFPFSNGSNS